MDEICVIVSVSQNEVFIRYALGGVREEERSADTFLKKRLNKTFPVETLPSILFYW